MGTFCDAALQERERYAEHAKAAGVSGDEGHPVNEANTHG